MKLSKLILILLLFQFSNTYSQTKFYRSASISAKNNKMVFESNRDNKYPELYMSNIDGSELIRLTNDSAIDMTPQWSPNRESIVYSSLLDRKSGNFDIFLLDIETMSKRKITTNVGLDMAPIWGPKGEKIYYSSRKNKIDELRVFDLATGDDALVMKNIEHHYNISFSPDGKKFTAVRVYEKNWDIVIVDLHSKKIVKRFESPTKENNPIWSPNGDKIFFASNRNKNWQIYSVDIESSKVKSLTSETENSRFFTLSPSGKNIYFTLTKKGENDYLYKISSDGTNKIKINF